MRRLVSIAVTTALMVLTTATPSVASEPTQAAAAQCHRTRPAYPGIKPGTKSGAVRSLQCVLNDAGFGPVTVDGFYGPETQAAVKKLTDGFECCIAHPLRVRTFYWVILFTASHQLHGLEHGDSGIRVKTLQRALRADGETLAVDGEFGTQTAGQVKVFQDKCGLKKTGRINDKTSFFLSQGGCNP
jgi:peptidoglycan hydrolase-like protein with peptidoglycan-binding domain